MMQHAFPMRILVASDGSGPSDAAIKLSGDLAAATGSELHVLHVTLVSRYIMPDLLSESQVARIKAEAQQRLQDEEARAKASGVAITKSHLRYGRPDGEILRLGEELGVGMIVIGNRSGDAMSRILLGSNAENVVRYAHCPVLVAREP